jgi:hypothetical protein
MIRKLLITIILSLASCSLLHSQDTFSIWGNLGLGLVKHQFDESKGGIAGSYGITARYAGYTLRYRLIDNSDFSLFSPAHELISRELLFGYAIHLTEEPRLFDLHLGMYAGIGSAEEVTPHYVSSNGPFDDVYTTVSRFSTCLPLEICFESRIKYYIGISHTIYASYSRFTPVYGYYFSIMIGYW